MTRLLSDPHVATAVVGALVVLALFAYGFAVEVRDHRRERR